MITASFIWARRNELRFLWPKELWLEHVREGFNLQTHGSYFHVKKQNKTLGFDAKAYNRKDKKDPGKNSPIYAMLLQISGPQQTQLYPNKLSPTLVLYWDFLPGVEFFSLFS